MCMCDDYYYKMLDDFKLYFPATAKNAKSWYPSGKYEITVICTDGSKVRYNGRLQTMRGSYTEHTHDLTASISKRLRRMLDERRMTQKELAEQIGVSEMAIGRYIRGDRAPDVIVANHISKALGCSLSELFEDY